MGGVHKGLLPLGEKPLLSHVIDRMRLQCDRILLSVEKADPCWDEFGLEQITDLQAGSQGPLGGVLATLEAVPSHSGWLLLAPCDAPFLPLDLADRLGKAAAGQPARAALVSYQQQWQPTFSLWRTALLPQLRTAVLEQGMQGLKEFLRTQEVAVVEWGTEEPNPFFNINTADDLAIATALLDPPTVPIS